MGSIDLQTKRAVMRLLKRGVVTVPEASLLSGVSRQIIRHWCKQSEIVIGQSRSAVITKAWRRAINE